MSSKHPDNDRRRFLKIAGLTSLASVPEGPASVLAAEPPSPPAMYVQGDLKPTAGALMEPPSLAVVAWNRMAFGPAPGDVAYFNSLGATDSARMVAFVDEQLDPDSIDDMAVELRLQDPAFRTLNKSLTQLWSEHYRANVDWSERIRPVSETSFAAFNRAIYSKRQLVEVLADFWHNHFNVFGHETPTASVMVHYDRDVIRAHVLGNFRDMLEASAKSTAMLYYLDNYTSSDDGPNENYARELLELHTMGAENYMGVIQQWEVPQDAQGRPVAYVDGDVLEVARCFTGWTVSNGHWSDPTDLDTGEFLYRSYWHDRFQKYVLGEFIPADQEALRDGLEVLDRLAEHPGTARHVCRKLCRRLVADNPPDSLVESAAAVFHANWQEPDQIAQTVRHILLSPEFAGTMGEKIKRPFETIVSAFRACDADMTLHPDDGDSGTFRWLFQSTGQLPFSWVPPNGFPDTRLVWQGSTPLIMTWRIINWLLRLEDGPGKFKLDVLGATLAAPEFANPDERTALKLAEFWFERILGYPPDYNQVLAVAGLLDHSDSYSGNWGIDTPIDLTVDNWPHYWQSGLRSMVGLILMSPEFLQR